MDWRKSTRSNSQGACVEVGSYRKSARSIGNYACAEAGGGRGVVGVRDAKDPERLTTLEFAPGAWRAFLGTLR